MLIVKVFSITLQLISKDVVHLFINGIELMLSWHDMKMMYLCSCILFLIQVWEISKCLTVFALVNYTGYCGIYKLWSNCEGEKESRGREIKRERERGRESKLESITERYRHGDREKDREKQVRER